VIICFQEGCDDVVFDVFFAAAIFLALISLGGMGEEGPVADDMLRWYLQRRCGLVVVVTGQGCGGILDQRTKPLYIALSRVYWSCDSSRDRSTGHDAQTIQYRRSSAMFRHAIGSAKSRHLNRLCSLAASSPRNVRLRPVYLVSSAALAASALWYSTNNRVHNDASSVLKEPSVLKVSTEANAMDEKLSAIVWGSNR
jgi:hypothetical protein